MRRIPIVKLTSILILSVVWLFGAGLAQKQIGAQALKSEPWTPPDAGASPKAAATPSGSLAPRKMRETSAVPLGMDPKKALAVGGAPFPKNQTPTQKTNFA